MSKPSNRAQSRYATEALALFGMMVRVARIEQKMSVSELAIRADVSRSLLQRIEEGDPGCSIGAAFEVAAILGVPLIVADPKMLAMKIAHFKEKLALLPKAARKSQQAVKDDF
ncbi:MAG: helix-turn-helix transcriptional regulator [Gallionella sp.]|nr:helix-turn-helix transcriptional regulator [Gallionella sp.]